MRTQVELNWGCPKQVAWCRMRALSVIVQLVQELDGITMKMCWVPAGVNYFGFENGQVSLCLLVLLRSTSKSTRVRFGVVTLWVPRP